MRSNQDHALSKNITISELSKDIIGLIAQHLSVTDFVNLKKADKEIDRKLNENPTITKVFWLKKIHLYFPEAFRKFEIHYGDFNEIMNQDIDFRKKFEELFNKRYQSLNPKQKQLVCFVADGQLEEIQKIKDLTETDVFFKFHDGKRTTHSYLLDLARQNNRQDILNYFYNNFIKESSVDENIHKLSLAIQARQNQQCINCIYSAMTTEEKNFFSLNIMSYGIFPSLLAKNIDALQFFFETDPLLINRLIQTENFSHSMTPIAISMCKKADEVISFLLDNKDLDLNIDVSFPHKMSLLHVAALTGCFSVAEKILQSDPSKKNSPDEEGCIPLMYAIKKNDLTMVKFLIKESSIDFTKVDRNGMNIFHFAAKNNNVEMLNVLYAAFSQQQQNSNSNVQLSPLESKSTSDTTPLMYAAMKNNTENVEFFLNKLDKENFNTPNNSGWSPLFVAIKNNNFDMVNMFLKKSPKIINLLTKKGLPLDLALKENNQDMIELLIQKNADHSVDLDSFKNKDKLKESIKKLYSELDITRYIEELIDSVELLRLYLISKKTLIIEDKDGSVFTECQLDLKKKIKSLCNKILSDKDRLVYFFKIYPEKKQQLFGLNGCLDFIEKTYKKKDDTNCTLINFNNETYKDFQQEQIQITIKKTQRLIYQKISFFNSKANNELLKGVDTALSSESLTMNEIDNQLQEIASKYEHRDLLLYRIAKTLREWFCKKKSERVDNVEKKPDTVEKIENIRYEARRM